MNLPNAILIPKACMGPLTCADLALFLGSSVRTQGILLSEILKKHVRQSIGSLSL